MDKYHRPRHWRGGFFLPFIFIWVFASFGHAPISILTWVVPIIVILALGAMVRNRLPMYQQPDQTSYKQSTYSNQYYRQQTYTPYQQGYQEQPPVEQPRETYQEGSSSQQEQQYQEYEQPQAQYPEQLPPMQ